ncbi:MAG: hypothetical protein AAB424_00880 [Patescibacteria group bacterium]
MASETSSLRKVIQTAGERLILEIGHLFTPIPSQACHCGKPVVFVDGKKTFTCTRCGAQWRLKVSVECTKKGDTKK